MRSPSSKFTASALWTAGIAGTLALAALALHASEANSADPPPAPPNPAVVERIQAFEAGTLRTADSPMSFTGPDGRPVYYFIGPSCDHFNSLFDAEGRFICAPSGGFTGAGDGKCPGWAHDQRLWRQVRLPKALTQPPSAPR